MAESNFLNRYISRITPTAAAVCLIAFILAGCSGQSDTASNQQQTNQATTNAATAQNGENESAKGTSAQFSVEFVAAPGGKKQRVEVAGLNNEQLAALKEIDAGQEQWTGYLKVSVATGESDDLPAMLGEYRMEDDRLIFEPRFPFQPGLKYTARFDPARLPGVENAQTVSAELSLPEPPAPRPTIVEQVYPSRNALPENQLKFYIHFSAPMSRGEAYDRIHLIESTGGEVDYPFLRLGEELWDPSGTRFTIFVDPGRIKRGLKPREDVGPALEMGKSYTLVIDADWLDANGRKLQESYRKSFKVVAPDETQPDPENWKFSTPRSGTLDPLIVTFAEPLDHSMLGRVLVVLDAAGEPLPGEISIDTDETRWQFRPERPWVEGSHALQVETTLEDLAGNSIGRPFEVDVFNTIEKKTATRTVSLPFEIEAGQ